MLMIYRPDHTFSQQARSDIFQRNNFKGRHVSRWGYVFLPQSGEGG